MKQSSLIFNNLKFFITQSSWIVSGFIRLVLDWIVNLFSTLDLDCQSYIFMDLHWIEQSPGKGCNLKLKLNEENLRNLSFSQIHQRFEYKFFVDCRLLELKEFISSNLVAWIQSYEFSKRFATFISSWRKYLIPGQCTHQKLFH